MVRASSIPISSNNEGSNKTKKKKRNMGVSFRLAFVFSARVVTALFYFEIVSIPAGLVDDVVRWLAGKNK